MDFPQDGNAIWQLDFAGLSSPWVSLYKSRTVVAKVCEPKKEMEFDFI